MANYDLLIQVKHEFVRQCAPGFNTSQTSRLGNEMCKQSKQCQDSLVDVCPSDHEILSMKEQRRVGPLQYRHAGQMVAVLYLQNDRAD